MQFSSFPPYFSACPFITALFKVVIWALNFLRRFWFPPDLSVIEITQGNS